MRRIIVAGLVLVALALPAAADARHHHGHHHAHAHRAIVNACEEANRPDEVSWAQWRIDMAVEGFTAAETNALEACGE